MKTSSVKNKAAAHKVSLVLTQMLFQEAFWGTLALSLEYVEDPALQTEATDGTHVRYNPTFINSLSLAQVTSEICHEINHCARLHPFRCNGRDPRLWNSACDFRINEDMAKDGYLQDDTWLRADWVKNMSEEQIYAKLEQMSPKEQDEICKQGCLHGMVVAAPGKQTDGNTAQDWKDKLLHAAISLEQAEKAGQRYGRVPNSLMALVEGLRFPLVDWRAATRKFIEATAKNDFSWERPDSCYAQFGVYVPSLYSSQLPPVVFYWDTSGSRWSDENRKMAASELVGMIHETRPALTYVIYGDTKVQRVDIFAADDEITFSPKGGGGTDFRPIFEYIEKESITPCCFIGLTDLDGEFPPAAPGEYPVLWVTDNKRGKAPFGDVLQIGRT